MWGWANLGQGLGKESDKREGRHRHHERQGNIIEMFNNHHIQPCRPCQDVRFPYDFIMAEQNPEKG